MTKKILVKLIFIKQIKSFGFTLKEIADLLLLDETNDLNCSSVLKIIEPKLKTIDKKIAELQNVRSKLIYGKDSCSGSCKELLANSSNSA